MILPYIRKGSEEVLIWEDLEDTSSEKKKKKGSVDRYAYHGTLQ